MWWSFPLASIVLCLWGPFFFKHQPVILVAEGGLGTCPWSPETTAIGVAAANCVCAGKGNNSFIVEPHAVEYVPNVLGIFVAVRKSTVRRKPWVFFWGGRFFGVRTTVAEANLWPAHLFDGDTAGKDVQVCVSDVRVLLLDRLQQVPGDTKSSITTMVTLRLEAHRRAFGTTIFRGLAPRAGAVPCQAKKHWCDRATTSVRGPVYGRVLGIFIVK